MNKFKEVFVHTPSGPLFGIYYSKDAYFENDVFYYTETFMAFVWAKDVAACELWERAWQRHATTGMQMMSLG